MSLSPSDVRVWKYPPLLLVLASAVIAACAYLQALHYPFFGDDIIYVAKNSKLAGQHWAEVWRFFVEPYNLFTEFLPLRDISYWFDITLFGKNPAGFRIHNILLYLACLPLIFVATAGVWRYFRPADVDRAPWVAAVVAALFAVHPSHVEAVVWIAGRKDVLSTLFSMLALWLAMRARQAEKFSHAHAAGALAGMSAAILSKATAAAVAPIIALLWLTFWLDTPRSARRPILLLWPLAAMLLAAGFALIFSAFMSTRVPFYFGIETVTRSLAALGWLARLAVSPEDRHYYYPVFEDPYFPYMVALGLAALTAGVAGMVLTLRKRSLAGFALAVFLLLCMPSMQLIPYAPPSLISDRFLIIAVWPAILPIVAMCWSLRPPLRAVLLLVIGILWAGQTLKRPLDWRSAEVLMDYESRSYPGYAMPAAYKIFNFQLPKGSYEEALETAGGITDPQIKDVMLKLIRAHEAVHVESASTGSPQNAMARLSELFQAMTTRPAQYSWDPSMHNLWDTVKVSFENEWVYLLQHFPDDALVHYNAGLWMANVHYYQAAIVHLRAATESQRLPEPLRGTAFEKLGLAFLMAGQYSDAESSLQAALRQPHHDVRIQCLLAAIYKQTGRFEEAARAGAQCLNAPVR